MLSITLTSYVKKVIRFFTTCKKICVQNVSYFMICINCRFAFDMSKTSHNIYMYMYIIQIDSLRSNKVIEFELFCISHVYLMLNSYVSNHQLTMKILITKEI